jgi:cell fate regulator YaaT (PSP1 superfamily)
MDEINNQSNSLQQSNINQCEGCDRGCNTRCNLNSFNWLDDVPGGKNDFDIVEVHFKNTRRGFYRNSSHLDLKQGDVVAVEANPGHDIGTVALTGNLVRLQMKRTRLRPDAEILRIFRKAKPADLERFEQAKAKEIDTMIRSRQIAKDLGLEMKIGDVEYQGDGNKAIFYYIADGRVDFRQLIKVLAEVFKIRVEMKQIGARQEAGRIGGIGPCGRPLCCASWMSTFVSVATSAARYQEVSLNPQKLAGQCAKLKCCINFEVDTYVEASKSLPKRDIVLETKDKSYYHFKTDILKREITYSTEKGVPTDLVTVTPERVLEVATLNSQGVKPEHLQGSDIEVNIERSAYGDLVGQDSISRFDNAKKKKKKKNRSKGAQQPMAVKDKPAQQSTKQQQPKKGSNTQDPQHAGRGKGRDNRRFAGPQPMPPTGLKEFRPRNPDKRPKINPNNRTDRSNRSNDNSEL